MAKIDFNGSRVWITGASSGIGRALALEFARLGARVFASARNRAALDELARQPGRGVIAPLPLDVRDRAAHSAVASEIRRRADGLDLAVLNAGVLEPTDARAFDAAVCERMMQTNVLGLAYGVEAALPLLRGAPRARLAGVASAVVFGPISRAAEYGASKAAVAYLLDSLRIGLAREHIGVSVIFPGYVRTPLIGTSCAPRPFMMEPEAAARRIVHGLAREKSTIEFPRRLTWPFRLAGSLPRSAYTRLAAAWSERGESN